MAKLKLRNEDNTFSEVATKEYVNSQVQSIQTLIPGIYGMQINVTIPYLDSEGERTYHTYNVHMDADAISWSYEDVCDIIPIGILYTCSAYSNGPRSCTYTVGDSGSSAGEFIISFKPAEISGTYINADTTVNIVMLYMKKSENQFTTMPGCYINHIHTGGSN